MAMALTVFLQATPGPVAQLPVPSVHRNELYTMLQALSLGGVRGLGAGRRGRGVHKRKSVLRLGFRAPIGMRMFPLLLGACSFLYSNDNPSAYS